MPDELYEARFIERVLDAASSREPLSLPPRRYAVFRMTSFMAAGGIAAVGLMGMMIWFLTEAAPTGEGPRSEPVVVRETASPVNRADAMSSSRSPSAIPVRVGGEPTLMLLPTEIRILTGRNTDLAMTRVDTALVEIQLRRGDIWASVDPERIGPRVQVATPHGRVSVTGTLFAVSVTDAEQRVSVLRGGVSVETAGKTARVHAGQAYLFGDEHPTALDAGSVATHTAKFAELERPVASSPVTLNLTSLALAPVEEGMREQQGTPIGETMPEKHPATPPKPSIDALLEQAEKLRSARKWQAAARAYRTLIDTYPRSDEARLAQVAYGNIALNMLGRPKAALTAFNNYLQSRDAALRQEALFGKAGALRALGLTAAEKAALTVFVDTYPDALQAAVARQRLKMLGVAP